MEAEGDARPPVELPDLQPVVPGRVDDGIADAALVALQQGSSYYASGETDSGS